MANYNSNYEIAQEISARLGTEPIPFDSVYSICLQIYRELGGTEDNFDSVYSILLEILPLVDGGVADKVIDDTIITTAKTWSSSKINSELNTKASTAYVDEQIEAVIGAGNSDIEGKETEDFTFVQSLPVEGEEGQQVIIKGDNTDTLYKYVSGEWAEQTPDATKLYFDTENEVLYSYATAEHQFVRISMVNTIVVGSNLNSNADLKALKTVGVYNVVQRLHNATKGDYVKNWTLYVESVDYEEYDKSDSVYQRLVSNYTIQKRTWSATRQTNDGWSNFSTYYAGEIKDTTTSKYYTWSSNKIAAQIAAIPQLEAGENVSIENGRINALGYKFTGEIDGEQNLNDILHEIGFPPEQVLEVKISGDAGATTYSYDDNQGGLFIQAIEYGIFPGVGSTYKTANGKSGVIAAIVDSSHIKFEETLDANNPLVDEEIVSVIAKVTRNSFAEGEWYFMDMTPISYVTFSGAAGATTYSYNESGNEFGYFFKENASKGFILKLDNGKTAEFESIDVTGRTVTVTQTFDAENAINNVLFSGYYAKPFALGQFSHAEGGVALEGAYLPSMAKGSGSHAEGCSKASGMVSHSEGLMTLANGMVSHAEGDTTEANGRMSHAEGSESEANGDYTHAEGRGSHAEGECSHAEGYHSTASGENSHTEGCGTTTENEAEHAEGRYNVSHKNSNTKIDSNHPNGDLGNTLHSIGNGYFKSTAQFTGAIRKNVQEIMQNGDMYVLGVGGYQGTDTKIQDNTIKTLQEVVNSKADAYETATTAEIEAMFS